MGLAVEFPTIFAPAVKRALHNEVYDALRRAVSSGALRRGQRVNEAEIARQMQISRAPVREAIRQLEHEGLLESVPRRGTFVVALTRDDVEEAYTLRADLEARAVRRTMARLTPETLELLDSLSDKMRSAAAAGNVDRFLEADIQFHRTIVEAAGWPRLRRIWESLHPQTLTLYTVNTLTDWAPVDHARRHDPLLAAIRSGDPDAAAAAIQKHILGVGAQVMRLSPIDSASAT
ncbi:MAG TPA: GntR family transcriptional regulator [Chloroflexota bacterium]|nr:GntR family transcriptional regulator [Chloroflexota bacterium]